MKPSYLSVCFSLILLSEMGFAEKRSYISWDDFKVQGQNLQGQNAGKKGLIVVDKNGSGDCLTVQAAVDMVPHHNQERIKIYILPGLYRFSKHSHSSIWFFTYYIYFCGFSPIHACVCLTWGVVSVVGLSTSFFNNHFRLRFHSLHLN